MATTLLDKQQKQLIKKFHTLLGKAARNVEYVTAEMINKAIILN